jgi:uroporphyrinogen-III decarboxylase
LPSYDDLVVEDLGGGLILDFYGRQMQIQGEGTAFTAWYVGGTLGTREKWDAWPHLHPRPLSCAYFEALAQVRTKAGGAFLPIPICQGIFAKVTEAMGFERFAYLLRRDPALVERALDQLLECKLDVLAQYARHQVPVVGVADDVAFKQAPMLSPIDYARFFVPRLRQLTDRAHELGLLVFMHSDGDVTSLIPHIIAAGFDGIECLEAAAGVDIFGLKKVYGDRITLMGNLDVTHLLTRGTPAEVTEQTEQLLHGLKPGGRYVFCPCADIIGEVQVENLLAAAPVVNTHGMY